MIKLSPPHVQAPPLASPPLPPSRKHRASPSQLSKGDKGEMEVTRKRARLCETANNIKAQHSSAPWLSAPVAPPQASPSSQVDFTKALNIISDNFIEKVVSYIHLITVGLSNKCLLPPLLLSVALASVRHLTLHRNHLKAWCQWPKKPDFMDGLKKIMKRSLNLISSNPTPIAANNKKTQCVDYIYNSAEKRHVHLL